MLENSTSQEVKNLLKRRIVARKYDPEYVNEYTDVCNKPRPQLVYALRNSFELRYEIVIIKTSPYYDVIQRRKQTKRVFHLKTNRIARFEENDIVFRR